MSICALKSSSTQDYQAISVDSFQLREHLNQGAVLTNSSRKPQKENQHSPNLELLIRIWETDKNHRLNNALGQKNKDFTFWEAES